MRRAVLTLLLPLIALGAVSCQGANNEVTGIAFTQSVYTLSEGETLALKVVLSGGEKAVQYVSTNEAVLAVNETGLATGLAIGEATVLAICNDYIARAVVTVVDNGLSKVPVYEKFYGVNVNAACPAFNLSGTSQTQIRYVHEDDPMGRWYAEFALPNNAFLESLASLDESPFMLANPDLDLGPNYADFASFARATKTGPFSVKALKDSDQIEVHCYDNDAYLGRLILEPSLDVDILNPLTDLIGLLPSLEDPAKLLEYLSALSVQDSEFLKFLSGLFSGAKVTEDSQEKGEGVTVNTTTVAFDENAGKAFFEYEKDLDFGEEPKLDHLTLTGKYEQKEQEVTPLRLDVDFAGHLNGSDNTLAANVDFPTASNTLGADFFRNKKEEFKTK